MISALIILWLAMSIASLAIGFFDPELTILRDYRDHLNERNNG